jgi:hypothetical protein
MLALNEKPEENREKLRQNLQRMDETRISKQPRIIRQRRCCKTEEEVERTINEA